MYVKREGTGPTILLGLHGWSNDHRTFEPIMKRVPAWATFLSADLPGYGRTRAPGSLDLNAITDEIIRTVCSIRERRLTLVGNCSGAIFGLLAARQIQERIERLVLIDAFAYMPRYFKLFTSPSIGRYAYQSTFANPVGRWLTNQSLRKHRAPETDLTTTFNSTDHEVTYRYMQLLSKAGDIEQFKDLSMPVDIVYGERSFSAIRRSVARWQSIWPHARSWELKGAGHLPMLEASDQLAKIIYARGATAWRSPIDAAVEEKGGLDAD